MKLAGDLEVILGPERHFAQRVEREPRHPHRGLLDQQRAALNDQRACRAVRAGQPKPGGIQRRVGRGIRRHVPDRRAAELLQAKIDARSKPHHLHVRLDQRDEGDEQGAVEPILVEVVRRDVRGRHHHDAVVEQMTEQPAEDHVGHVELVEAQQPSFLGERCGDRPDRVVARDFAALEPLAPVMNALVHVDHELMKMDAALAHHRARGKKQIHQHGFAAPDLAENVEALERRVRGFAPAEQPAERGRFSRQPVVGEPRLQLHELFGERVLCRITRDLAGRNEGRIMLAQGVGH